MINSLHLHRVREVRIRRRHLLHQIVIVKVHRHRVAVEADHPERSVKQIHRNCLHRVLPTILTVLAQRTHSI